MKCIITGHTSKFGQRIYNYFIQKGWEVIGVSRTTGYDLSNSDIVEQVINEASNCDLFIISAPFAQDTFIKSLYNQTRIIVIGTVSTNFAHVLTDDYSLHKKAIEDIFRHHSLINEAKDMLLIKISALENSIVSDYHVSYDNVIDIIKFWMTTPIVNVIETQLKLTPYTKKQIKQLYNIEL